MPTPTDPQLFDRRLRELTEEAPAARPFLCDGLPFGCNVFLVGINPGTDTAFWPHWNTTTGCNKQGWLTDYLATHGRYQPTRERIERLCKALAPLRFLETNIFPYPSRRESELATANRDTRVFDFLLETVRPSVTFVHGKSAVAHLAKLTQTDLPLGQFIPVKYQGIQFEVIAGHHLSYQWSFAKVEALGQALRDKHRSFGSSHA